MCIKNLIESGISNVLRRCSSCFVVFSERLNNSGSKRFFLSIQTMCKFGNFFGNKIYILCELMCSFV